MPFFENLVRAFPKEPIVKYLLAREEAAAERYDEAMRLLDGLSVFRSPVLEHSRQRRLAQLAMALGHYQKSKLYYWQSLNHAYRDTQSLEIEERLRFCDWMDEFGHRPN